MSSTLIVSRVRKLSWWCWCQVNTWLIYLSVRCPPKRRRRFKHFFFSAQFFLHFWILAYVPSTSTGHETTHLRVATACGRHHAASGQRQPSYPCPRKRSRQKPRPPQVHCKELAAMFSWPIASYYYLLSSYIVHANTNPLIVCHQLSSRRPC